MMRNNSVFKIIMLVAVMIVVGYSAFTARYFIAGPKLNLDNVEYIESGDPLITISGNTSHVQALWVNGHEVLLEEGGVFTDTRTLTPGISYITVRAKDRFEREETRVITAYYNPPHQIAPEAYMTSAEVEDTEEQEEINENETLSAANAEHPDTL